MRLLPDTHIFLWALDAPERLGSLADDPQAPGAERLVSAVVAPEIAIKHGLGRLEPPAPPHVFVLTRITRLSARAVPVEIDHATGVADLPPIHHDPFDRLLVAQARALGATLVTADPVVARYPVPTLGPA